MTTSPSKPKPLLFISHKHVDKKIADVISSFIRMRSGGAVSVFQSSSPWADAPQVGRNLNKQLVEALWKSKVVILIYTDHNQDWNYCMWECGVALHPQSPDTRVILFQCKSSSPALFGEQVNVNARDLVDIQKFTDSFLTDPNFFPKREEPITQFQAHGQEVASAAAELSQDLKGVLPPEDVQPSEEWPAAAFLQLELSLDQTNRICNAEPNERLQIASEIFEKECLVIEGDKYCCQLFGLFGFSRGMTFGQLINGWRERNPFSHSRWVEALQRQMIEAARWQLPTLKWELMEDVGGNGWYAPVLTRVRKAPSQQCMQFNIYFYKFEVDSEKNAVKISIPNSIKDMSYIDKA